MTVVATNPDARAEVLAHSEHNDPPQDGNQFYMVTIQLKYHGEEPTRFDYKVLKAAGQSSIIYSLGAYGRFNAQCATSWYSQSGNFDGIPNDIRGAPEVFTGGEITGNVCWEIASTDADSLQVFVDVWEQRTRENIRTWFALR